MIVGYKCLELLNLASKSEAGRGFLISSGPFEESHQRYDGCNRDDEPYDGCPPEGFVLLTVGTY